MTVSTLPLGDTAGHFFPALAVVEAFERRVPTVDAIFIGPAGGEAELPELFVLLAASAVASRLESGGRPASKVPSVDRQRHRKRRARTFNGLGRDRPSHRV